MNFKSFSIINALIALASAKVGNINDFKDYPGIIDLIEANTVDYAKNFIHTFTDGPIYSGDGTAYGDARSGGNCLFPKEEYYEDMMYAALNNEQYNEDMGCGLCAVVVSTSNPYKAVRIRIIDQCPECEHGSLDFSDIAFKALSNKTPDRIKITWALIPCDVDVNEWPALVPKDAELKFQFKTGSTEFWGEVEVYNTLYPVVKVQLLQNGEYVDLYRRAYNYWALSSGGFGAAPYTFRVTLADNTIIEAKDIELVIPSSDEGDEFSSGTQTIIQQSSTIKNRGSSGSSSSSGSANASNNSNKKTTTTKNAVTSAKKTTTTTAKKATTTKQAASSNAVKCSNNILKQGYSCCEKDNCDVYYTDEDGNWGVSNNLEWCGISNDCKSCSSDFTALGYSCCEGCDVVYTDETGDWGVENNEWCGIPSNC